jgi:hypothetical protein
MVDIKLSCNGRADAGTINRAARKPMAWLPPALNYHETGQKDCVMVNNYETSSAYFQAMRQLSRAGHQ